MRTRWLATAVVAASALVGATAAPALAAETVTLPFFQFPSDGSAGPVSTTKKLQKNKPYLVTVQGTVSAFLPTLWNQAGFHTCGTPEPAPMFPTANATGPVGGDAQFTFARPFPNSTFCPALPQHHRLFQINFGAGFLHVDPFGGIPAAPSTDHAYSYLVVGQENKPIKFKALGFQQIDSATGDNYGAYQITVRGKKDCKNFASFPISFADKKACDDFFKPAKPPKDDDDDDTDDSVL
jgi:hypothetical protein